MSEYQASGKAKLTCNAVITGVCPSCGSAYVKVQRQDGSYLKLDEEPVEVWAPGSWEQVWDQGGKPAKLAVEHRCGGG